LYTSGKEGIRVIESRVRGVSQVKFSRNGKWCHCGKDCSFDVRVSKIKQKQEKKEEKNGKGLRKGRTLTYKTN